MEKGSLTASVLIGCWIALVAEWLSVRWRKFVKKYVEIRSLKTLVATAKKVMNGKVHSTVILVAKAGREEEQEGA